MPATVSIGVSGVGRHATAAVVAGGRLLACCEQERITRVRRAGLASGALPVEAIGAALSAAGLGTTPDRRYAASEPGVRFPPGSDNLYVDHHRAHAAASWGLSSFDAAAVVILDRHANCPVTVWRGADRQLAPVEWPAGDSGLAAIYSQAAAVFGLGPGQEHELEALARLDPGTGVDGFDSLISYQDGSIRSKASWLTVLADRLAEGGNRVAHRAAIASALQQHLGRLLLEILADVRRATGERRLSVGGGLFFNTYFTTLARKSTLFDDVFVPPNPGTAGTAVGAALVGDESPGPLGRTSPFLGPEYGMEELKQTLDNCKLSYECLNERELVDFAVECLARGELVGWFQGRMEWGHRALGNRSILASPLSPYVLDNLNVYLKHRPRWRAYGLSVPGGEASRWFEGPAESPFMECEYSPRDPDGLRHVMPAGTRTLRVQTISPDADPAFERFHRLHERFGQATGVPILVNTSFNGFLEPMVCSPRDAIRVFFGTGLDVLVLDRFVIRK